MPGTIGGAFIVDYLGPKNTMVSIATKITLSMVNSRVDTRVAFPSRDRVHHERGIRPVRLFHFARSVSF